MRRKKSKLKIEKKKKNKKKIIERYFITYVPEVQLLEKGKMPKQTKMGEDFKGKNRIIVSK